MTLCLMKIFSGNFGLGIWASDVLFAQVADLQGRAEFCESWVKAKMFS